MMIMTAKLNPKKGLAILIALALGLIGLIMLFDAGADETPTVSDAITTNDDRVRFLSELGWDVITTPAVTSQVRIPDTPDPIFTRYNDLQKSLGYDLSAYAGKNVMRYVYRLKDRPEGADPIYATLLISSDQIIGGDITDTAASGQVRGLQKAAAPAETQPDS